MNDSLISDTKHSKVYITYHEGRKLIKKVSGKDEGRFFIEITHPNIIKPIEMREEHILLPFYEKNLRDNPDGIPYTAFINMCRDLLLAVQYLHSIDIVHADIKPANILLDGYTPILIDFTSAFFTYDDPEYPLTTYGYEAPEVLLGRDFGKSIDIWALGIVFLEIICGENTLMHVHVSKIMKILGSLDVKEAMNAFPLVGNLIKKMLIINPKERPSASKCLKYLQ
jgi:serine/threonine protein kinase